MKLGFLGAGKMASAIINGLVSLNRVSPQDINIYDPCEAALAKYGNDGYNIKKSNIEVVENSDYIILAVKPNKVEDVLNEISDALSLNSVVISIAAGWTTDRLQMHLPENAKVVRIMPNTPALVRQGVSVISGDHTLSETEIKDVIDIFSAIGIVEIVDPALMDGITALSGSGPAYVYLFIQALADAGVKEGLPRQTAIKLAAQTVLGAAQTVLSTNRHPIALCDDVCSPAGTTIEAVYELQNNGFSAAVMKAVVACAKKSKEMSATKE